MMNHKEHDESAALQKCDNMMNKKALQLPITFIVILIITIILISLTLYLLNILGSGAEDITNQLDATTRNEIEFLLAQENAIVAVPFNVKEAESGQWVHFGLGIKNIGDSTETFRATVQFANGYDSEGKVLSGVSTTFIQQEWVARSEALTPLTLGPLEQDSIPFVLKAHPDIAESTPTLPGEYVFNVCVYKETVPPSTPPTCAVNSLVLEGSQLYPPNKISQVTVRVK